jgi:ubiquinone/menaquinone biosynthesis C-methylase UbiE
MSHANAWSNPSTVSAQDAARMASFLEERARLPDQARVNAQVVDALGPISGERILEVGCGSGALCRLAALCVRPRGHVTGLDISPDMIAAARRYADEPGLAEFITFDVGSAEALPYAGACFDAAFAVRLMLHVERPASVLREMMRVVRRGGRIVLMDWDWETVAVDHPDRELTRRLLHWRCDHHGGNNWSGRQLRRLMLDAGLHDVRVTPVVTIVHDDNTSLAQSLWRAAKVARDGGAITPDEHAAWTSALKARLASQCFFASIAYFVVCGVCAGTD